MKRVFQSIALFALALSATADTTVWKLPLDKGSWRCESSEAGSLETGSEKSLKYLRIGCVRKADSKGFSVSTLLPERISLPEGRLMARYRVRQSARVMMGAFWAMSYEARRAFGKPVYRESVSLQRFIDELMLEAFPLDTWMEYEEDVPVSTNIVDRFTLSLNVQGGEIGTKCEVDIADFELFVRDDPEIVAKRREWENFRRTFRADRSDGSKYLRPKEGNRFACPFRVAKDGKPACRIVLASTPFWYERLSNETTAKAADELQRLLFMITGAKVPIVGQSGLKSGTPSIYIGKGCFRFSGTWRARTEKQTAAEFLAMERDLGALEGTDGYAIRSLGRDIYVYGATEKGAMNGVYALVENNTDFIAVRPNPKSGCVFTVNPNLSLVWGEKAFDVPKAKLRGFWNILDFEYWNANYSSNSPRPWTEDLPYTRGGHNINRFLPHFDDAPEFYGIYDGVRRDYGTMQCFAKPDFDETTLSLLRMYARSVQMNELAGISLSLDDTKKWCQCRHCLSPIRLADGTRVMLSERDFMSTRYFLWLNKAAREIAAKYPGKGLNTLAYFQSAEPPRCAVEKNVRIGFCPYPVSDDLGPVFMPRNIRWLRRLKGWAEKCDRRDIYIRGYDGLGMDFPRPLAHTRQRNLKEFYKYADGISSESLAIRRDEPDRKTAKRTITMDQMDLSAIEFWVMMRLYWNPDEDVEGLYKKFCWRAFREAAVPMERFYGRIREEVLRDMDLRMTGCINPCSLKSLDELLALLDEAESAVKHPASVGLVAAAKRRFLELVEESRIKKGKR